MNGLMRHTDNWWSATRDLTFWERWHIYYLALGLGLVIGFCSWLIFAARGW